MYTFKKSIEQHIENSVYQKIIKDGKKMIVCFVTLVAVCAQAVTA